MSSHGRLLLVLYLAMLGISALGAYVAAGFDAPYGLLVELEAVLRSVLGGLCFAPLFLYAALGRRGLVLGSVVALLAVLAVAALHPLYVSLYRGYTEPASLARYVAMTPLVFIITLGIGLAFLPYLPILLLRH